MRWSQRIRSSDEAPWPAKSVSELAPNVAASCGAGRVPDAARDRLVQQPPPPRVPRERSSRGTRSGIRPTAGDSGRGGRPHASACGGPGAVQAHFPENIGMSYRATWFDMSHSDSGDVLFLSHAEEDSR